VAKAGKVSSIVVSRLLLADPRGEIPEKDLQEFMENYVEPTFWIWYNEKKGVGNQAQAPTGCPKPGVGPRGG